MSWELVGEKKQFCQDNKVPSFLFRLWKHVREKQLSQEKTKCVITLAGVPSFRTRTTRFTRETRWSHLSLVTFMTHEPLIAPIPPLPLQPQQDLWIHRTAGHHSWRIRRRIKINEWTTSAETSWYRFLFTHPTVPVFTLLRNKAKTPENTPRKIKFYEQKPVRATNLPICVWPLPGSPFSPLTPAHPFLPGIPACPGCPSLPVQLTSHRPVVRSKATPTKTNSP